MFYRSLGNWWRDPDESVSRNLFPVVYYFLTTSYVSISILLVSVFTYRTEAWERYVNKNRTIKDGFLTLFIPYNSVPLYPITPFTSTKSGETRLGLISKISIYYTLKYLHIRWLRHHPTHLPHCLKYHKPALLYTILSTVLLIIAWYKITLFFFLFFSINYLRYRLFFRMTY